MGMTQSTDCMFDPSLTCARLLGIFWSEFIYQNQFGETKCKLYNSRISYIKHVTWLRFTVQAVLQKALRKGRNNKATHSHIQG